MDLNIKYCTVLSRLEGLPNSNRARAKYRFLILREFEDLFEVNEKEQLGDKYRSKKSAIMYCAQKGISITTFYRWKRAERENGIEGLIPLYGIWEWENEKITFVTVDNKKHKGKKIVVKITLDLHFPLSFLSEIKELILSRTEISPDIKQSSGMLLNYIQPFLKRKFIAPQDLTLTKEEISQLRFYKKGTHKNHSSKAKAILMAHNHHSIFKIVVATGKSRTTIYRWLRQFKEKGLDFVETKMDSTKRDQIFNERSTRVVDILHAPPSNYDINRTSWTYDTIIQAYKQVYDEHLSKGMMQRIIKKTGYTWRHARKVLTSKDPDYQKKISVVLEILRNTREDEAFFFVDELGPYKVKSYGGKSLTPEGLTKVVPQHQQTKGAVEAIAALEAFTNQLTWNFTCSKNSTTIIGMLDKLRNEYYDKTKLYITWDSISSHRSCHLLGWVANHNEKAKESGCEPLIEIVPLPSNAQFVNVIESVFGGMKKAVIQNSNYASKSAMEAAIDRHFAERNIFFKKNPKRAGNKIWDKQAFEVEELAGGLFKKM